MKTIMPHLHLGNEVDAFTILNGLSSGKIKAILDLSTDLPTSKWRKDKTCSLKKVGVANRITCQHIKKINAFISEQHKQGHQVMVCGKNETISSAAMVGFLTTKKNMLMDEATNKVSLAGGNTDFDERTLNVLNNLKANETDATS